MISLPEHFYQVIEGPAQAIDSLLHKLKKDRRHHSIRIFSDKTVQAYEFGKWAMIHHEIDEEYEDYFWVLSRYASDIQLKNASTSGIEMLLKGFSN